MLHFGDEARGDLSNLPLLFLMGLQLVFLEP
jgi:hypothetical protein